MPTNAILLLVFGHLLRIISGSRESAESLLIKNLFEDYSKYAKPTLNSSGTVELLFGAEIVQIVSVMMPTQILRTKLWARMQWKNELMAWDPSHYDGVKSVRLDAVDVWTPDIQLYDQFETSNNAADDDDGLLFKTQVVLESDGTTSWNSPATFSTSCELDVSDFPYDKQLCKLKFGPWNSDISILNMTADTRPLTTDKYVESSEWELLSASKKRNSNDYACCKIPFSDVTLSLEIRRKPLFYWFNLVIPYALLLMSLWVGYFVPPQSGERISLSLVILLAFSIIVQATSAYLPRSNELPALSILYFVVMIEVAVSSLVTCTIVRVHFTSELGEKAPMPNWIHNYLLLKGEDFLSKIGLISKTLRDAEANEISRTRKLKEMIDEAKERHEMTRTQFDNDDESSSESERGKSANEISVSYQSKQGSLWKCSIGYSGANQIREGVDDCLFCNNDLKLNAILNQIRNITRYYHDESTAWELSHKWQRLAVVLDRLFFILLSIFTVFTFLSFTVIKPAFFQHEAH